MKCVALVVVWLIFTSLAVAAEPMEYSRRGDIIGLKEYLDRIIIDQNRYIDTRFNAINGTLVEKQRAIEVGSSVLDEKFVRINDFMSTRDDIKNAISAVCERLSKLETKLDVSEKEAETLVAKWGIGIAAFFTVVQILIHAFNSRWYKHKKE